MIGQVIQIFPGSELGSDKEKVGFRQECSKHFSLVYLYIHLFGDDLLATKSYASLTQ